MTAAQALELHGLSGESLIKLSRKAAQDALRRAGGHLDQERFDELAEYMLEIGVRYATRYETGHGIAIQTYLYRIMRRRYVDWLRLTLGDNRAGRTNQRIPPGGRTWPLDEAEEAVGVDHGYELVEVLASIA